MWLYSCPQPQQTPKLNKQTPTKLSITSVPFQTQTQPCLPSTKRIFSEKKGKANYTIPPVLCRITLARSRLAIQKAVYRQLLGKEQTSFLQSNAFKYLKASCTEQCPTTLSLGHGDSSTAGGTGIGISATRWGSASPLSLYTLFYALLPVLPEKSLFPWL